MTVPSYTEDLTDLTTAESNTNWVELTGTIGGEAYNVNGTPVGADGDYPFIQGNFSVTQDCTKDTSVGSLAYNNGSGTGGHGTDGAYFVWQNYMVASNVGTYAQGGFQICVGSGTGAFDAWYVGGSDKSPYPYGGWVCNVANTTVTPDGTAGSPTATEQYIGSAVYIVTGSSKGEVHNCDVIRYGRGSAIFEFGEAADYALISGYATQNDNSSNRWGLIQETAGGYLWKGRMQLGTATNAVDLRDSAQTIFVQWTPKVTANFNLIECINTSSNIEMPGFTWICLDTSTASQGRFLMTDQCDVDVSGSTFVDMDTFVFDKGSTKTVDATNCVFRRCAQVTGGEADFDGSTFEESTVAADGAAMSWDETISTAHTISELDNCTFSMGTNNHHAISFSTNVSDGANITLNNIEFTGFDADGTGDSDNSIIELLATTGTITITLSGCTVDGLSAAGSNFTVDTRAGCSVLLVFDTVTTSINVKDNEGNNEQNVKVWLAAADGTGDLPFNQAITSITRSGTTATVTFTAAHGMATNDYIKLSGITDKVEDNNGAFLFTFSSTTVGTYQTTDSGSTSYTGTITGTGGVLYGDTDASGNLSSSRTWGADQPVTGQARKSTSSPRFKTIKLDSTILSASGLTINRRLVLDE